MNSRNTILACVAAVVIAGGFVCIWLSSRQRPPSGDSQPVSRENVEGTSVPGEAYAFLPWFVQGIADWQDLTRIEGLRELNPELMRRYRPNRLSEYRSGNGADGAVV
jgi:hypothetical protein